MIRLLRKLQPRRDDRGVALVTVMLVVLLISALTATVATVSINNRQNANSDRISGSALGAADAGVAQAITYIRGNSIGALTCQESSYDSTTNTWPSSCTSLPSGWANPASSEQIALGTNGCRTAGSKNCAEVYITAVDAFSPPLVKTGVYDIHSLGLYGPNPGGRAVVVTVHVTPDTFPVGVFGATTSANGATAVQTESLFTQGCVSPLSTVNGNGLTFGGIDAYWGQPAAPHSTVGLSTSNNKACTTGDSGRIPPGPGASTTTASDSNCTDGSAVTPSNRSQTSTYNGLDWFQSGTGGLVSSTAGQGTDCWRIYTRSDGTYYPDGVCPSGYAGTASKQTDGLCDTTAFTLADLQRYGFRPRGLSDAEYAALKARAQSLGTYNIAEGSISAALTAAQAAGVTDPVLYWDCSVANACNHGAPTLKISDFPSLYTSAPVGTGSCPANLPIVTIVVVHSTATTIIQGGNNDWIDAAVFVPDGAYGGNGGGNIYGTMFANQLNLGGNQNFTLDQCWVQDFPGADLVVTVTAFRENDTIDLQ